VGSIGDPFTLPIPTVGTAGPTYATQINAFLVEAATRLSSQVPFGAVNFGADLPLNGQNILNVGYMTLVNTLATPGASPVNRITAFAGDLWYVSPSGAIQLTTGATLNAAALGGITGDYGGASPAQFRYNSVTSRYTAYANFGTNTLGYVQALGFDIAGSGSANVRLSFGGSISQTYTLPSVPATTGDRPLYINASGAISVGHGTKTSLFGATAAQIGDAANVQKSTLGTPFPVTGVSTNVTGPATSFAAALSLDGLITGQLVSSVSVDITKVNTSTTTYALRKLVTSTGVVTTLATASSAASGAQTLTITPTAFTVTAGETYAVVWTAFGPNAANEFWSSTRVNYSQPG
jgi:hypothetical protein